MASDRPLPPEGDDQGLCTGQDNGGEDSGNMGNPLGDIALWNIPVYFLDDCVLAEEFVASMLSKCRAYRWPEANGFRRCLIEGDI